MQDSSSLLLQRDYYSLIMCRMSGEAQFGQRWQAGVFELKIIG